jgi:hypothetical protein
MTNLTYHKIPPLGIPLPKYDEKTTIVEYGNGHAYVKVNTRMGL